MLMQPEEILFVHRGALGDFLNAWPAMLAVRLAFPETTIRFSGRNQYRLWLDGLSVLPCRPEAGAALDRLFLGSGGSRAGDADPESEMYRLPPSLARTLVVWFGLGRRPPIPEHEAIVFLRGTDPDDRRPPRELYRKGLAAQGIGCPEDHADTWRRLHGGPDQGSASGPVLLFPGAGHRLKRWPLVQFLELASRLAGAGLDPVFVLGPAETGNGVEAGGFPCLALGGGDETEGLARLQATIRSARYVVGNDCGPMHLAGLAGVPGLVLFGPTDETRWGPPGLRTLSLPLPCRPCTVTTADLACLDPRCLADLDVETVTRSVLADLRSRERR
jgi:hypothetical protein